MSTASEPINVLPEFEPEAVAAAYRALALNVPPQGAPSQEWERLFGHWNDLKIAIGGETNRRDYRAAQDTRDEDAEDAARFARESIAPIAQAGDAVMRGLFLESPSRPALEARFGARLFRQFALEQEAFAPQNVPLGVDEGEVVVKYRRLVGSAALTVRGETLTLAAANALCSSPDPAVRREAWEARQGWLDANRAEFHHLYDQLVALRTRMGKNLGEENFVPLGYRRMGRLDYGPAEVAVFRAEIKRFVSPVLAKLRAAQAASQGTETLAPWDLGHFPAFALAPDVAPVAKQLDQAGALFERLHPRLAEIFGAMRAEGLIDLESRPGKRAGAFATSFDDTRQVAILCNSTGGADDVGTLLHEMGHAFQAWESRDVVPVEQKWPTMETAELHSMGMEFLGLRHIDAFFAPEDATRFARLHLAQILTSLPYMALVDEFQHWVYEHPEHSHAEREARWAALWAEYLPGAEWADPQHARAVTSRWMVQSHLFASPFYYIDYAIAQSGALQLWRRDLTDHEATLDAYLEICRLGGTDGVDGVFAAAGLRSAFEPGVLESAMARVASELGL